MTSYKVSVPLLEFSWVSSAALPSRFSLTVFKSVDPKRDRCEISASKLRLNVRKIDGWLEELARYRNAVNGDNLHNWFGYFDLGKTVSATASAMLTSGLLYNTLVHHHVEALQVVFWELSPAGEKHMNEQFRARRDAFNQLRRAKNSLLWLNTAKPEAAQLADYWEHRLRGHRATLEEITGAIPES